MKVYKVELLVMDFDNIGEKEHKNVIENTKYPNRCINPHVMKINTREIEWSDDHPLNKIDTFEETYENLFKN